MTSKFNPNASVFIPKAQTQKQQQPAPNNSNSGTNSSKQRTIKQPRKQQKKPSVNSQDFLSLEDQVRNKRGQISINHLLEFNLPSREEGGAGGAAAPRRRPRRKSGRNQFGEDETRPHLVGDEFINANFKFIVDARYDYREQIKNPNLVLHENQILRVVVHKGDLCPICLTDEIVAPRMISCGHVFCLTCLLKTFAMDLQECPICASFLEKKPQSIKKVLIDANDYSFDVPKVNQESILKLMVKPVNKILPLPLNLDLNFSKVDDIPWISNKEISQYSRIMKGNGYFIIKQLEDEKFAILEQLIKDQEEYSKAEDEEFVNRAIDQLDAEIEETRLRFGIKQDEQEEEETINFEHFNLNNDNALDIDKNYFFYETGFNTPIKYFLSPLDNKILLKKYGHYSKFPTSLIIKVDNITIKVISEELVKKQRNLNYLPIGFEIGIIDVNWEEELESEELAEFKDELVSRHLKSIRKLQKEEINRKKYQKKIEIDNKNFYQKNGYLNEVYEDEFFDDNYGGNNYGNDNNDNENNDNGNENDDNDSEHNKEKFQTTIWGTKILKAEDVLLKEQNDLIDGEEMIKNAKLVKEKKGKKKKLVLLTTTTRGK